MKFISLPTKFHGIVTAWVDGGRTKIRYFFAKGGARGNCWESKNDLREDLESIKFPSAVRIKVWTLGRFVERNSPILYQSLTVEFRNVLETEKVLQLAEVWLKARDAAKENCVPSTLPRGGFGVSPMTVLPQELRRLVES